MSQRGSAVEILQRPEQLGRVLPYAGMPLAEVEAGSRADGDGTCRVGGPARPARGVHRRGSAQGRERQHSLGGADAGAAVDGERVGQLAEEVA